MSQLRLLLLTAVLLKLFVVFPSAIQVDKPKVLLRVDDIGMNHSVNLGVKQLAETGIPFSTSVMFACPWYQEAVAILKKHPNVSVGVHLTLNSEWKYYRWGPVLGKEAVPSLVDSVGYFLPSSAEFLKSKFKIEEVERELSAQVERAMASGLKIDYVDYHMGTAVSTPELRAVVEKVAKKYGLGISRYFGEAYKTMFDTPVESKQKEFLAHLKNLKTDQTNLIVIHEAVSTPEMIALVDMNNKSQHSEEDALVAKHREAELKMLLSKEFQSMVGKSFNLITYKDLIKEKGLEGMKKGE